MTRSAVAVILLAATAAAACQGSGADPGPVPRIAPPPGAATARPAAVTLLLAIRDPDALRRAIGGIARRVLAMRTQDVEQGDVVGPALGLSAEAGREIDFGRPSWFVAMSGGGDRSHHAVLLPVADAERFWRAATGSMRVRGRREGFAILSARDGKTEAPERLVAALGADHVVIVDDPAAFAIAGAYLAGELATSRPAADVEVRLFIEAVVTHAGVSRDQVATLLMAQAAVALVGASAARDVAATAELAKGFRSWFAPLVGMREVGLQLTLGAKDIEARLTLEPGADAEAGAVVKRQRPGPPLGAAELPGNAWLVWADRARADDGKLVDVGLAITGDNPVPIVGELLDLVGDDQLFTGDYTIAAHPAAVGNGIGVSAVAGIRDRARAEAAILGFCRKYLQPVAGAPRGQQIFETALPEGWAQELARLIGPRPRVAIGFAGDRALVSIGAVPEAALATMLDPETPRATRLVAKRALARQTQGDPRRVGFAFVSLVDLAGQLVAVAPMEWRRNLGELAGQHDDAGVLAWWGVDAAQARFELAARIPLEHVARALGPVFREVLLARYLGGSTGF